MRSPSRSLNRAVRLAVEALEDRLTPAVAYGLQDANLISFDTAAPNLVNYTPLTGVTAGETLVGIDFRPQNGYLYGLGVNGAGTGTLYTISTRTGVAAIVAPNGTAGQIAFVQADGVTARPLDLIANGATYGFDFNPAADRIRVTSSTNPNSTTLPHTGLNFRINPNTGLAVDGDAVNAGTQPDTAITAGASGAAYTNNQPTLTATPNTTLYLIDADLNQLNVSTNPNGGTTTTVATITVGGATLDVSHTDGFDIAAGVNAPAPSNTPVAAGTGFLVSRNIVYSLNLVTGVATALGTVPGSAVSGLAVQPDATTGITAIALDSTTGNLVKFNTLTPGTTFAVTVSGLTAGETLVGIDYRPQTGQLYGLGVNAVANTATLYLIDPQATASTATLTAVGTASSVSFVAAVGGAATDLPDPATVGYGFDFNPAADRIRVTTGTGSALSFRINPITGAPVDADTTAAGINPDPVITGVIAGASGAGYTNNFGQTQGVSGPTTLYGLDDAANALAIINPTTSVTTGNLPITLGGGGLDFTAVNGFDIPGTVSVATSNAAATGTALATLVVGGAGGLYSINLATGVATLLGTTGTQLTGFTLGDAPAAFTLVPSPGTFSFSAAALTVPEAQANPGLTVTRTQGNTQVTVTVTVTGGTATAGTDFTGTGTYTLVFAPGVQSVAVPFTVTDDTRPEPGETVRLSISAVTAGAIGTPNASTVTISDNDSANAVSAILGAGGTVTAFTVSGNQAFPQVVNPFGGAAVTGIRVAKGDVTNDGFPDVVAATTRVGGGVLVNVYDGQTGAALVTNFAVPALAGNTRVSLIMGDLNGDGVSDFILGGNSAVFGFSGVDFSPLGSFTPFAGFNGGVNVTAADLNTDGRADFITSTASLFSFVAGFSGADLSSLGSFDAGNGAAGVSLGSIDANFDGTPDFVVGNQIGAGSIKIFSGRDLTALRTPFSVFLGQTNGVNVAVGDQTNDGIPDLLLGTANGGTLEGYDGLILLTANPTAFRTLPFGVGGGVFFG